ncbi:hypothetical protein NDU88_001884 [Pleurodeles waltl]|uniref:Uncharacterized protein n=1 Tax=Pleurodeles waltl TaxID=8319 RepID=A0AAV7KQP0_PLEWA|nr:hypothetical protein NDU88_001884 [Pleurodeles waltl]
MVRHQKLCGVKSGMMPLTHQASYQEDGTTHAPVALHGANLDPIIFAITETREALEHKIDTVVASLSILPDDQRKLSEKLTTAESTTGKKKST